MSDENQNVSNENEERDESIPAEGGEDCANCANSRTQMEEYKQGWQRAQADYVNLQKETQKQKSEWMQMIKGDILESFIPVYDNFKKAFSFSTGDGDQKQFENWKKGIEYIMKQFGDVLKQNSIEEIKTVGEMFDPRFHEIVGEEEVENIPSHQIVKEMDGGYKAGEKVLKVAKVVVAK